MLDQRGHGAECRACPARSHIYLCNRVGSTAPEMLCASAAASMGTAAETLWASSVVSSRVEGFPSPLSGGILKHEGRLSAGAGAGVGAGAGEGHVCGRLRRSNTVMLAPFRRSHHGPNATANRSPRGRTMLVAHRSPYILWAQDRTLGSVGSRRARRPSSRLATCMLGQTISRCSECCLVRSTLAAHGGSRWCADFAAPP